jgi:hypothetical protein
MGDADIGARPVAGPGGERQPSLLVQKVCLAVIVIAVIVTVVVPTLIWAAGILLAGSR